MSEGIRAVTETYAVQKRAIICDRCKSEHLSTISVDNPFMHIPVPDGWIRVAVTYGYDHDEVGISKGLCQLLDFCSPYCLDNYGNWGEVELS